jgi:dihydrolipoamide dehydrogenase
MVVGELAEPVDLLVAGGGPGGYVAALRAAQLGREVTLVERGGEGRVGGDCLHVGCIPSKALIELAHAAHRTRTMTPVGLLVEGLSVDLVRFQAWKGELVTGLATGVRGLLTRAGVRVIHGDLRFNQPDRAAVRTPDGEVHFLEFAHAIVATGSRPAILPALPPDGERVLDSTGALALDAVPAHVAVVGAGYIGLELGTALAKLGARVRVVEALDRVLPTVDEGLTGPVRRRLEELGVELHLGSLPVGLEGDELVVDGPAGPRRVPAEKVVVAAGRVPNTDDLGLDRAGVPVGEGGLVPVDAAMLATPRIAAIGDIVAGPALAHKASAEGVVAAEALCGRPVAFEPAAIPAVIFTDPEVATVGLSEAEAEAAGLDVTAGTYPLSASGRAATLGARDGFVRVVADAATDRVVGLHVVGAHASELVAEGALAVEMMASPEDLAGTIHPHPTLSEGVAEAAERLLGRPLHVAGSSG